MEVTVYTKPQCVQCDMTKKVLDGGKIPYKQVDITEDKEAYDYVISLGYTSAPIIVTDAGSWSGFKFEQLKSLVARYNAEPHPGTTESIPKAV